MIAQLTVFLLATLAVSANPAAKKPWYWLDRPIIVDPISSRDLKTDIPTRVIQDVVVSDCGKAPLAPPVKGVIVGGTEAPPHSFPWQVALYIDYMYFCGGAIISDQWVLTSAHCVEGARFADVLAGAHDLTKEEPSQVTLKSHRFIVHENFTRYHFHNNIALIHLPQKLTFNDYIQPVCLPYASEDDLGSDVLVTATGWGETRDSESSSTRVLMEVQNPTISNTECQKNYGSVITSNEICTSTYGSKGTCDGDDGGPLNYKTGGVTETRGIVSFGGTLVCKGGHPNAFTRVSHYVDWIKSQSGVTRG